MVMTRRGRVAIWVSVIAALTVIVVIAILGLRLRQRKTSPVLVRGAVIKQSNDTNNQSPIADVEVNEANGLALEPTKTDFSGAFTIRLRPEVLPGQQVTLTFRHPDYRPADRVEPLRDTLYVVRMVP